MKQQLNYILRLVKWTALHNIDMFILASFLMFKESQMISFACRYGVHVTLHKFSGEKVNVFSTATMAVMYIYMFQVLSVQTIKTQADSFSKCCIDKSYYYSLAQPAMPLFPNIGYQCFI